MTLLSKHKRLAALIGVVALAVAVVLVVVITGEDHEYDEPVIGSTLRDFPARGPLADDTDLIEEAADVWRSGDDHPIDTKPATRIELLWAGKVAYDFLPGYLSSKDEPDRATVVILRSGAQVAAFTDANVSGGSGINAIAINRFDVVDTRMIRVSDTMVLASDENDTDAYDAVDESGGLVRATVDDGFIGAGQAMLALKLDESGMEVNPTDPVMPGLFFGDRVFGASAKDLEVLWRLLTSREYVARTTFDLLFAASEGSDGSSEDRWRFQVFHVVRQATAPHGKSLLIVSASGRGSLGTPLSVAAAEYGRGDQYGRVTRLGSSYDPLSSWVAAGWIGEGQPNPYFVVVGGRDTRSIRVYLGKQSKTFPASGGTVTLADPNDAGDLPDVVVAGFDRYGKVVAPIKQR